MAGYQYITPGWADNWHLELPVDNETEIATMIVSLFSVCFFRAEEALIAVLQPAF
jgi:hypothetical protein